jgi:hypothetical protein
LTRHRGSPVQKITPPEFDKLLRASDDVFPRQHKVVSGDISSQPQVYHTTLPDPVDAPYTGPRSSAHVPAFEAQKVTATEIKIPNYGYILTISEKAVKQKQVVPNDIFLSASNGSSASLADSGLILNAEAPPFTPKTGSANLYSLSLTNNL